MMKKIISLITILCLILPFMYATQSYAETNDVSFSVKKMNIQRGETITEVVDMNCTTNFSAANFVLTYDSNVLEYVPYYDEDNEVDYNQNCGQTILNSSGIPNATVLINSDTVGTIKVGYMSTKSVAGKSGEFLKFKFKVKDNAAYGNSNITINATTLKDENGTNTLRIFIERWDEKISDFDTLEFYLPSMKITKQKGFSEYEVSDHLRHIKNLGGMLFEVAKEEELTCPRC